VEELEEILNLCPVWREADDRKLAQLLRLLTVKHRTEKVLIFSQFADTVNFLIQQIQARGLVRSAAVTGGTADPTDLAWQFSPRSNNKTVTSELRILVSTDILSEGQNLQDCRIVVNYDLPWAIVRLIQRAGRVDRIGQESERVLCYSFLPADGVEQIINLRGRLRKRLQENRSVIGTDENFFEDEVLLEEEQEDREVLENLYHEKSGILDEEEVNDVDLTSEAYQVWKNATENNPSLRRKIKELPNCAYSSLETDSDRNAGIVALIQTGENTNTLVKVNYEGELIDHSQTNIFRAIACDANTEAILDHPDHHELVKKAAQIVIEEE
ncbi:MAG: C-terminal helicase domain-containing protein, partial [Pseudanabaena sp.]